jgi:hypothetical protein
VEVADDASTYAFHADVSSPYPQAIGTGFLDTGIYEQALQNRRSVADQTQHTADADLGRCCR